MTQTLQQEVETLRQVPLFSALDPARLKLLAFTSERLSFQSGQELFHQGDQGDSAYVILNGTADIVVEDDGIETIVASIGQNAVIGEIAVLCEVPRTASVRVVAPVDALKIDSQNFLAMLREFPEMGLEVMRELANRLSVTTAELSRARAELKATGNPT